MTARVVLGHARRVLNDTQKQRHKDGALLELLEEGQKEIARKTNMFRGKANIPLIRGQAEYKLPSNAVQLLEVISDDIPLKIVGYDYFEGKRINKSSHSSYGQGSYGYSDNEDFGIRGRAWQATEGERPSLIVVDSLDFLTFRVFPIPTAQAEEFSFDAVYGMPVGLSLAEPLPLSQSATTGMPVAIADQRVVQVIFARMPNSIETLSSAIELPEMYWPILKHYVAGMALRYDTIARNVNLGASELGLFSDGVETLMAMTTKNWMSSGHIETIYNPIGR